MAQAVSNRPSGMQQATSIDQVPYVAMEGLEGSLLMAQAALNVKNKAIGELSTTEAATQQKQQPSCAQHARHASCSNSNSNTPACVESC
jgi:hypothetical protein